MKKKITEHLKAHKIRYISGLILILFFSGVSFKKIIDPDSRKRKEKVEYIIVHYTANTGIGAGAAANAIYLKKKKNAGAHYIIDDNPDINEGVIIGVPEDRVAYSVGDRKWLGFVPKPWHKGKIFNENSISFEMCLGGGRNDSLIIDRTAQFVAWQLLDKGLYSGQYIQVNGKNYVRKIPDLGRVVRHHDVSGKQCPKFFYKGSWDQVREDKAFYKFKLKVDKYFRERLNYEREIKNQPVNLEKSI